MNDETLRSFNNDELASSVFLKKYAINGEKTLDDMRDRLTNAIMVVEKNKEMKEKYRNTLNRFLPAGRVCYGLGNNNDENASLSNCYVLPSPEDDLFSIYETAGKQARTFSRGGGVGFDISKLRPRDSIVNNVAKTSTGAVSFMDLFSMTTGLISQNSRRGALMLSIDCKHPDLIEFINIKGGNDKSKIQFANISIRVSDDFMNSVVNNKEWEMVFTTVNGEVFTKKENAKNIWDLFVESNWKGAEPALLYWDNILKSPASCFEYSKPVSTNPCAEEPLPAYGSCNLGAMNLSKYVINPFKEECMFDFDLFCSDVKVATDFMNNVNIINKERQPLPENRKMIEMTNAIGIGITGLADMLIKMNLKYDTDEAISFTEKVVRTLKESVVKRSIELAKERGSFKLLKECNEEERYKFITHPYFDFLKEKGNEQYLELFHIYGTHNIQFTTVAPTGSLSIILQTGGSGIEPLFNTHYERTVLTGDEKKPKKFIVYSPITKEYLESTNKDFKDNSIFVTANQIDWKKRVEMQSVIQKYISESISSTVNLPNDIKQEVISDIYIESWKKGLKGITIYRDGCREGVLNNISEEKQELPVCEHVKFPETTDAKMRVIKSEGKKWYVTYTIDNETKLPNSLFVNTNAIESNITTSGVLIELRELAKITILDRFIEELDEKISHQSNVVKTARYLSLLLRHRVPIIDIIKSIEKANIPFNSFAYRIKGLLAEFIEGKDTKTKCIECGGKMVYEGGCAICKDCGYSKCG